MHLRHGWEPTKMPLTCVAKFNLTHALHGAMGGYTRIRQNEIKNTFANLMIEICHEVEKLYQ